MDVLRRGFDAVRGADIAEAAGVSEKTVFNSFPTKESLVLDREEELTAQLVDALRDRAPGTSPVDAVMAFMEREAERYRELPAEATWMLRAFDRLIRSTPALIAAQRAMTRRMVEALARSSPRSSGRIRSTPSRRSSRTP